MKTTSLMTALLVPGSFLGIVGVIVYVAATGVVTPQLGLLLGIAAFGCYVGFGVLIAVHRLINRLD